MLSQGALGAFGGRGVTAGLIAGLVCMGLVGGAVSPSWAAEGEPAGGDSVAPVVGGFGLGDGLEAMVGERDGSLSLRLPVGGLKWDSRSAGVDRVGFGKGWTTGIGYVDTQGGVRMVAGSGEVFRADAGEPSGLAGYELRDLRFTVQEGTIPARADGLVTEQPYGYLLKELGGVTRYFNAVGDPVMWTDEFGNRTDLVWTDGHRLVQEVDPDGVVTTLDWDAEPGSVLIHPGSNLPAPNPDAPEAAVPVWRVKLQGGRVTEVVDPVGARTVVKYDSAGLVSSMSSAGGSVTRVAWLGRGDGVPRVDRVRTLDSSGVELSVREWDPVGRNVSSGWPVVQGGERAVFESGQDGFRYTTALNDGHTRVESEYNSQHLLVGRQVHVQSPSGDWVVQEQAFTYFGTEAGEVADPATLPGWWSRPTKTQITHHDRVGGSRTVVEEYEFDEQGRPTKRNAVDGTVTEISYDETIPASPTEPGGAADDSALPVGLPVLERTVAADGLASEMRYELNDDRTAVVATETWSGKPGEELTRVGRSEFEIDATGFVTAERIFEQGGAGTSRITTFDRTLDLASGTVRTSTTVGAGTDVAATAIHVGPLGVSGTASMTDPAGNTTTTQYDIAGRVAETTDPAGRRTQYAYETVQGNGRNATTTTTPDGIVTTELRDELGRAIQVTDNIALVDPDKGAEPVAGHTRVVESRAYPDPSTVEVTDAWGATTTSTQDVFGQPIRTVAPNGLVSVTEYDNIANTVTTALTATGDIADAELITTRTRDDAGRVTATEGTRADGLPVLPTKSTYDGFGRMTTSTDGFSTTSVERDVYGNPTTTTLTPGTTSPAGQGELDSTATAGLTAPLVAERRFDAFGTSVEKTLSDDATARSGGTREMDGLGRTVRTTDQLDRDSSLKYTADGLVSRSVDGSGQATEFTYHDVTRQLMATSTTSPIGEPVTTAYTYDPVTGAVTAVFDPADREATEIGYAYDAFGNTTQVTYPDGNTIRYAYDQHGRNTSMTDVAGNTTQYTYDQVGLLTHAEQTSKSGVEIAQVRYAHDLYGRVTELTRGNGVTTTYEFTSANQIGAEVTTHPDGTVLSEREYTYEPRGNLTQRVDTTRAEDGTADVETTTYKYDSHGRLTGSTVRDGGDVTGPVTRDTTYELSAGGDVTSETTTTGPGTASEQIAEREFTYSPLGELTATATTTNATMTTAEQAYDGAGNLTHASDGTSYAYDALNRPITETTPDGQVITTAYWADGTRRHLSTDDPTTGSDARTEFYWSGSTLLSEIHTRTTDDAPSAGGAALSVPDPDGATALAADVDVAAYLIGTTRHARSSGGDGQMATAYYGMDRHGNVTDLTNQAGEITDRYAYTDYGTPTLGDPTAVIGDAGRNPFGYAGEYTNPNPTGSLDRVTQHLDIRTYQPGLMRFLREDPTNLHNRYAFGDLNPIMMVDPSGRAASWDTIINGIMIGLAVVAFAVSALTAAPTAGASLLFFAVVDFSAAALGSFLLIDEHDPSIIDLPGNVKEGLTYAEYALAGIGVAGAIGSAMKAGATAIKGIFKNSGPAPTTPVGSRKASNANPLEVMRKDSVASAHPVHQASSIAPDQPPLAPVQPSLAPSHAPMVGSQSPVVNSAGPSARFFDVASQVMSNLFRGPDRRMAFTPDIQRFAVQSVQLARASKAATKVDGGLPPIRPMTFDSAPLPVPKAQPQPTIATHAEFDVNEEDQYLGYVIKVMDGGRSTRSLSLVERMNNAAASGAGPKSVEKEPTLLESFSNWVFGF